MASFKLRRKTGGSVVTDLAGPSTTLTVSANAKIEPAKKTVSVLKNNAIRATFRVDDRNDSYVGNMSSSVRDTHKAIHTSLQHDIIPGFSDA